jgi:hypothetical protein
MTQIAYFILDETTIMEIKMEKHFLLNATIDARLKSIIASREKCKQCKRIGLEYEYIQPSFSRYIQGAVKRRKCRCLGCFKLGSRRSITIDEWTRPDESWKLIKKRFVKFLETSSKIVSKTIACKLKVWYPFMWVFEAISQLVEAMTARAPL